ncbi:MAG: hypothetical protein HOE80_03235 [Candidatus Magasanikbacteria bacterium]|nr:hypothetical protein [Candidatus Magasanikbacteria bacterium]
MKNSIHIKYITTFTLVTILALFSIYTNISKIAGILIFSLFTLTHGYIWGKSWIPKQSAIPQFLFGSLLLYLSIPIIATPVYWFFGWSNFLASGIICLISILSIYLIHKKSNTKAKIKRNTLDLKKLIWGIIPILGSLLLLGVLYTKQYGGTLYSPWTLVGPKFFTVFAITTILYLFIALKQKTHPMLLFLGSIIHYILILSVAIILFKNGYGYDPVIHQASETYIRDHGMISPKNPYYLGQYMLVLFISALSHISIISIDTLLVPLLASIYIPLFLWHTYGYKHKALWATILLTLVPLSWFIFTTPFNLTLLFSTLVALWIWHIWDKPHRKQDDLLIGLFTIMTLITHAIAGIPLAIIILAWRFKNQTKTYLYPLYSILLAIALPLGLILYMHSELRVIMPWEELDVFISFFKKPHWELFDNAPRHLQLLYHYKALIPYIILTIMGVGLFYTKKEKRSLFFLATSFGLFFSGAIIATIIRFPNMANYEYGNYAKRLLMMAYLFLLPAFASTMIYLYHYIKKQKHIIQYISIFSLVILLTISWFFTYPTRNALSYYTGISIRNADKEAVHFIHERNDNTPDYIVLTNQMVGVTAMKEFGFLKYHNVAHGEQYFYSIPTGAPMYSYFAHMVYDEPKRAWMIQAMDYAGVNKAYFIHTSYWSPAAYLRDEAKKEANAWWTFGADEVWVYEYVR